MGVANSPLRDRVVFVQGVPRSGTTVLLALLAAHPQIVGSEAESHLFDFGVDRLFDNFEGRHPQLHGLRNYFDEREQLVDLARDLCDGVLTSMRAHLGSDRVPELVIEKTPTSLTDGGRDLRRKREIYPDAWYLHIVRDGDAVARSLMRAPWFPEKTHTACLQSWSDTVEVTRQGLADHPRYREVDYESLRDGPVEVIADLFEWVGLGTTQETLEVVNLLSREQFSDLGALPSRSASNPGRRLRERRAQVAALLQAGLNRVRSKRGSRAGPSSEKALSFEFVRALRERDEGALKAITSNDLSFVYRSADGDWFADGPEAHRALADLAKSLFGRIHAAEWWASTGVGPGEWWTAAPGKTFALIYASARDDLASRVDFAFCLSVEAGSIARVLTISAGPLAGRPPRPAAPDTLL